MKVNRKIYFDKTTGICLVDTGETDSQWAKPMTINEDIATFTILSERNRDTFDVIELPFGAFSQDFAECNGYRVNITTGTLEFSYPDPNQPTEEPVFQPPLTEQIKTVKEQQSQLSADFQGLTDYLAETGVL